MSFFTNPELESANTFPFCILSLQSSFCLLLTFLPTFQWLFCAHRCGRVGASAFPGCACTKQGHSGQHLRTSYFDPVSDNVEGSTIPARVSFVHSNLACMVPESMYVASYFYFCSMVSERVRGRQKKQGNSPSYFYFCSMVPERV